MTDTDTGPERLLDPTNPPDPSQFADWTIDQIETGLRIVNREKRAMFGPDGIIQRVTQDEADARNAFEKAYATARLRSKAEHPSYNVDDHKAAAVLGSLDERLTMDIAIGARRAAFARLESLSDEASCLQTCHRRYAAEAG